MSRPCDERDAGSFVQHDDVFDYDVFLSYSTDPDYRLARKLESFLERFHELPTPNEIKLNELRICRDGSDFKLNRGSESKSRDMETLYDQLQRSRRLLVLCSRNSRNSAWMDKELAFFLNERPDSILVAVTEGIDPGGDYTEVFSERLISAGLHNQFWYDFREGKLNSKNTCKKLKDFDDERTRLAADLLGISATDARPIWFKEQQRRARRLQFLLAAVASVIAIFATIAVWQYFVASAARYAAESNFNVSVAMIKEVFKVQDRLEVTPNTLIARQDINAIILDGVEQLHETDPLNPEVSALDAHVKMDMSMIIESYGVSDKEGVGPANRYVELVERAVSQFRQLVTTYPRNAQYQRDFSWACRKLARVHEASGEFESAHRLLNEALRAIEIASSKEPTFRRDLRWVLMNLGDLARSRYEATDSGQRESVRSELEKALKRYLQALDVPNASPSDETIEEKHAKCSILDRICDTYLMLAQPEESKKRADELIAIRKEIVNLSRHDKQARQHLSLAYFKMGNALVDLGKLKAAVEEYQHTLSIRSKLLEADPGSLGVKRGVAESYGRIGSTQLTMENAEDALLNLRKSNEIMEEVIAVEPKSFFDTDRMFATDFRIAESLWSIGQFDQSMEQFRAARKRLVDFDEEMVTPMFQGKIGWISEVIDKREKERDK